MKTDIPRTFLIISRWIFLIMRNISDKTCRGNQNTHFVISNIFFLNLTFMGPCIADIFPNYQQDAALYNLFISVKCSTCFRRYLRPSSGAQNCIYSIGYLSSRYCCLPLSCSNSSTIAKDSSNSLTNAVRTVLSSWWWAGGTDGNM
jgi:hypothetical protein